MNVNQIMNLVFRMFFRKVVSRGMDAGINRLAGKGKSSQDMSAEEHQLAANGKKTARGARQAMKLTRRIGRM